VELLERDAALAALVEARDSAARGDGRVAFVTGEPGIGKTSLVTRFVDGLDGGGRVLVGTCDDLTIPRPLGPLRDLAPRVSAPLAAALTGGAAAHDVQALLLEELARPPRPTVLVLEDVHWADDATFDSITVLGRRIASLPALLVLTFRAGEAMAMYHWEADQEDFLVVSGEALLVVEGEERPLRQWDFVHCPAGANHTIVGAGGGPCAIVAIGARDRSTGPDWGGYPPDETARRQGVSVDEETTEPREAYARFPARRPTRYRDGWLEG